MSSGPVLLVVAVHKPLTLLLNVFPSPAVTLPGWPSIYRVVTCSSIHLLCPRPPTTTTRIYYDVTPDPHWPTTLRQALPFPCTRFRCNAFLTGIPLPASPNPPPPFLPFQIYYHVAPDPTIEAVHQGLSELNDFKPDVIIAMGGGSPMDAAKVRGGGYLLGKDRGTGIRTGQKNGERDHGGGACGCCQGQGRRVFAGGQIGELVRAGRCWRAGYGGLAYAFRQGQGTV